MKCRTTNASENLAERLITRYYFCKGGPSKRKGARCSSLPTRLHWDWLPSERVKFFCSLSNGYEISQLKAKGPRCDLVK